MPGKEAQVMRGERRHGAPPPPSSERSSLARRSLLARRRSIVVHPAAAMGQRAAQTAGRTAAVEGGPSKARRKGCRSPRWTETSGELHHTREGAPQVCRRRCDAAGADVAPPSLPLAQLLSHSLPPSAKACPCYNVPYKNMIHSVNKLACMPHVCRVHPCPQATNSRPRPVASGVSPYSVR